LAEHSHPSMSGAWQRVEDAAGIARLETYRFRSQVLREPESRVVQVYPPPQYWSEPGRRFPVFYLHDGQNLFDPRTSFIPGHTWHAHTTADRLATAGEMEPVILVGVAHGGLRRVAEYSPTRDAKAGGGEGAMYGRILIEELKPLVDGAYRTLPDARNTAVGGASLGGLISLWLGLERADVFGKVAAISPSVWWDGRSILRLVERAAPRQEVRIWMDMGTAEGPGHLSDAGLLYRRLRERGWREGDDLAYFIAEGAGHDEDAWAARFDRVLRFLFPAV
jgi:predicted alpha/beta superfamily hydrolase